VPISTNPKVWFTIDGRPYQLKVGRAYEVNNQKQHSVMNKGDEDRLTFIFDYMPPGPLAYPPDTGDELPESPQSTRQGFRKLLGKERNFLLLQRGFDVVAIRNKIDDIPDARWLESKREQRFDIHSDTQSLDLVHFFRDENKKPQYRDLFFEMQNELKPAIECVANYYRNNGFLVRMLLAKLPAGSNIPNHNDFGYALLKCHRVHIPIITNDRVVFTVGGEKKHLQAGEFWEINNALDHSVDNLSDEDRVHLIIDWIPNPDGRSEQDVLASLS